MEKKDLELIQQEKPGFCDSWYTHAETWRLRCFKNNEEQGEFKKIPVMMLTNYGREEYREATEKLNIVDFLVKTNIDPSELIKRVSEYLQNH